MKSRVKNKFQQQQQQKKKSESFYQNDKKGRLLFVNWFLWMLWCKVQWKESSCRPDLWNFPEKLTGCRYSFSMLQTCPVGCTHTLHSTWLAGVTWRSWVEMTATILWPRKEEPPLHNCSWTLNCASLRHWVWQVFFSMFQPQNRGDAEAFWAPRNLCSWDVVVFSVNAR